MTTPRTTAWVDATAGVAGDMLLGALLDAGADLDVVSRAVDAVVPGSVRLGVREVRRGGLRAAKADVEVLVADPPHRRWETVRTLLEDADPAALTEGARRRALAVFRRLAEAEARVHGVRADEVAFHEVGALDAVADVVGTCAALDQLGVTEVVVSVIATGSGWVRAAHGLLPVPGPAVLAMTSGWDVVAGGGPGEDGELATPTGVALVTALAGSSGPLPALRVTATGTGAGARDVEGRPNVVRVVVGTASGRPGALDGAAGDGAAGDGIAGLQDVVLVQTTVDDLDPRVWPEVLEGLLAAGALDAWLAPLLGKKGRPAHELSVLCEPGDADDLSWAVMTSTSTLGVRRLAVRRDVLARDVRHLDVDGAPVRVKVGHRDGVVVQAMPEFSDVVALARSRGEPALTALVLARAAATDAGLLPGAPWPPSGTGTHAADVPG